MFPRLIAEVAEKDLDFDMIRREFPLKKPFKFRRHSTLQEISVRQHSETSRYRHGVGLAWRDLFTHLPDRPPSALPPRERRAAVLFRWLTDCNDTRPALFFCDEEGRLISPHEGGRESWEWWFEGDQERGVVELDAWESRELRRRGGCRGGSN
ncbi:hypothetical protein JCM11641_005180 [Rhodosporidiobolus odoratus]